MRFDSRVFSFKSVCDKAIILGVVGVVTSELLIEEAILLEDGSHVELLEAHFVD